MAERSKKSTNEFENIFVMEISATGMRGTEKRE